MTRSQVIHDVIVAVVVLGIFIAWTAVAVTVSPS